MLLNGDLTIGSEVYLPQAATLSIPRLVCIKECLCFFVVINRGAQQSTQRTADNYTSRPQKRVLLTTGPRVQGRCTKSRVSSYDNLAGNEMTT
jgi:hypothetical protein